MFLWTRIISKVYVWSCNMMVFCVVEIIKISWMMFWWDWEVWIELVNIVDRLGVFENFWWFFKLLRRFSSCSTRIIYSKKAGCLRKAIQINAILTRRADVFLHSLLLFWHIWQFVGRGLDSMSLPNRIGMRKKLFVFLPFSYGLDSLISFFLETDFHNLRLFSALFRLPSLTVTNSCLDLLLRFSYNCKKYESNNETVNAPLHAIENWTRRLIFGDVVYSIFLSSLFLFSFSLVFSKYHELENMHKDLNNRPTKFYS